MIRRLHPNNQANNLRSGATLTEVLMSLLIFSVGIVSVFTLFPVALLSSIQATKLTNSKILADNVVELVRTNPGLLRPPGVAASNDWEGIWEPLTAYQLGDLIWPTFEPHVQYPIPNLAYVCTSSTGQSGAFEPDWRRSGTIDDGDLEWQPITSNANYVVDPLGRFVDGTERPIFGFNDATAVSGGLPRTQGGAFASFSAAQPAFSLPDTWTTVFDDVPLDVTGTSVTFTPNTDLSSIVATNHRVVVVSLDGQSVARRNISNKSSQTLNLSGPALPGNLNTAAQVGRVLIEAFNPRYSYFFTVRRPGPFDKPTVTAVVVFNRSFSVDDEEVYNANFGSDTFSGGGVSNGSLGTDQLMISWSGEAKPPLLREGNYVFDARAAIWYQMNNIQRNDAAQTAVLTLDRTVEVETTSGVGVGRAIFMPGIVKVFEL